MLTEHCVARHYQSFLSLSRNLYNVLGITKKAEFSHVRPTVLVSLPIYPAHFTCKVKQGAGRSRDGSMCTIMAVPMKQVAQHDRQSLPLQPP